MELDLHFVRPPAQRGRWDVALETFERLASAERDVTPDDEALWGRVVDHVSEVIAQHASLSPEVTTDDESVVVGLEDWLFIEMFPDDISLVVDVDGVAELCERDAQLLRDVVAAVQETTGLVGVDTETQSVYLSPGS
jgi:hypothetical protein